MEVELADRHSPTNGNKERRTACRGCLCSAPCIFSQVPDIERYAQVRIYSADCTIFRQHESAKSVFVVRSGWIRESHLRSSGKMIRRIVGPGSALGVEAVLTGGSHEVTAESMAESELICLSDRQFRSLLDTHPRLAQDLLKRISFKLQSAMREFYEVASKKPSSQRLLERLQALAQRCGCSTEGGTRLSLPLSVQDMADEIGCSRQWATKLFGQLEAEGFVRRKGSWITLLKSESQGLPLQDRGLQGIRNVPSGGNGRSTTSEVGGAFGQASL